MSRLLLTLALGVATTAAAQPVPDSSALAPVRRGGAHAEAGQALLTVGVHAAAVYALLKLPEGAGEVGTAIALASPALVGGVACGAGALLDVPGSCRKALLGSLIGAAPGLAIVGAGLALHDDGWDALGYIVAGGLVYIVAPPFVALEGYRRGARTDVALVALPVPEGRRLVPGAAFRATF